MSLEETRGQLLNASETAEDLLALVCDLYAQELHTEERSLALALAELHNTGVIDILKMVKVLIKNPTVVIFLLFYKRLKKRYL